MPNHVRTQIRDAAVNALDALTTTSTRCYGGLPGTRPLHTLPALLIYTKDEEVERVSRLASGFRMRRTCNLVIEGYVASTTDADLTCDTINAEVEAVLGANTTLGGLAKDLELQRVEKEDEEQAEKPTYVIRMTYRAEYHTLETTPTAALA
jgi:hypothetical protein